MREKLSAAWFKLVVPAQAASLFLAAFIHTGIGVPGVHEPAIAGAVFGESVCGLALLAGVFTMFAARDGWARMMLAGHILALAGVILGIIITSSDGTVTTANAIYHRILLVTVGTGLLLTVFEDGLFGGRDTRSESARSGAQS